MPAASANGPGLGSSQVLASEVVASRTAYEGLSPAKAVGLAKSTFGVQQPTWTAPWVAAHGRLEGFLNDYVAEVSLPSQPHVLIQSSAPLRVRAGSRMVPLSLGLEPGDGGYVPAAGVVPLVIRRALPVVSLCLAVWGSDRRA